MTLPGALRGVEPGQRAGIPFGIILIRRLRTGMWTTPKEAWEITSEGCAAMTRVVMEVADTCCDGKQVQALLINYLFTLYWGYGINKDFLAGSGFQHLSGFTILYVGFGAGDRFA